VIGIVIPVHNEEKYLRTCLCAIQAATVHAALDGEEVRVVVVLDDCSDTSDAIVAAFDVDVIVQDARNVGVARAAGATHLLEAGARWLAFTDADTVVSGDWLAMQLSLGADAVCGTVAVDDWSQYGHAERQALVRARFSGAYRDADGHTHIHGANLGVSAQAYLRVGGFPPLRCSEDVALVQALLHSGAAIAWSAAPRVITSARIDSHARGGFGDTLAALVLPPKPALLASR
jgi:glycosyltransferase involved in cell wall biosynthesis